MEVNLIPFESHEVVWPLVRNYMKGAADYTYGRFEVDDIKIGLAGGNQQLWAAYEDERVYGAVVTEIVTYPRMQALVMHFTGGIELPRWKPQMLESLQVFGKENNCDIIESYGRPGWERVFKDDGFKSKFLFYELPVAK